MRNNFSIRPDYEARQEAETFESNAGEYWNPTRKKMSMYYQWHVYDHLRKLLQAYPKGCKTVLDVGCGYPRKAAVLIKPLVKELTLIDQPTLSDIIAKDFPDIPFVSMDLENPQHNFTKKYDFIICSDVIEHLLMPDGLMEFIRNSLSPDGVAILSTPERHAIRGEECLHSPKPEHVREWNFYEFANYVTACGFNISEHVVLPHGRITSIELLFSKLFYKKIPSRRYSGCQMVVCNV